MSSANPPALRESWGDVMGIVNTCREPRPIPKQDGEHDPIDIFVAKGHIRHANFRNAMLCDMLAAHLKAVSCSLQSCYRHFDFKSGH